MSMQRHERDAAAARLADQIDGYLGLVTYLARPESDIVHATRRGVRPLKPRRPKLGRDIGWSPTPALTREDH